MQHASDATGADQTDDPVARAEAAVAATPASGSAKVELLRALRRAGRNSYAIERAGDLFPDLLTMPMPAAREVGFCCEALDRHSDAADYFLRAFIARPDLAVLKRLVAALRQVPRDSRHARLSDLILTNHCNDQPMLAVASFIMDPITEMGELFAAYSAGLVTDTVRRGLKIVAAQPENTPARIKTARALMAAGHPAQAVRLLPRNNPMPIDELRSTVAVPAKKMIDVVAPITVTALGDYLARLIPLGRIKVAFPWINLIVVYKPDRPFKKELEPFFPFVNQWRQADTSNSAAISAAVGPRYAASIVAQSGHWTLIRDLPAYPAIAIPDGRVAKLLSRLTALGPDPSRWLVTLHYRQGGTAPIVNPDFARDVFAENFHRVADFIISRGGQVARLGHPGMDRLPKRDGYFDLSEQSLDLQLFAVSRSRFMLGTDSGMVAFGLGLGIPTCRTNVVYETGLEGGNDIILLRNVCDQDGAIIPIESWFQNRTIAMQHFPLDRGYHLYDNTLPQLTAACAAMLARTDGVGVWRSGLPPATPPAAEMRAATLFNSPPHS